jgi:putative alpha-1,2-mannosidase
MKAGIVLALVAVVFIASLLFGSWKKHHLHMTTSVEASVDDSWRGAKVDPFIGSAGTGHTTPGAHLPFGMITLAPLTASQELGWQAAIKEDGWDYAAGYQRGDRAFRGVAHTATSGAGICLGLDVIVSPFRGLGSINTESAHPGYYSAQISEELPPATARQRFLRDYSPFSGVSRVSIELAAGVRYGIHRYTFETGDDNGPKRLFFRDASFEYVSPTASRSLCAIEGMRTFENEWTRYQLYFHAELNVQCDEAGEAREVAEKVAEEAKRPKGWKMDHVDDKRTRVQRFLRTIHPSGSRQGGGQRRVVEVCATLQEAL